VGKGGNDASLPMLMIESFNHPFSGGQVGRQNLQVPGSGPTSNRDFPVKSTLSPDPIIEEKGYRGTWFNK